MKKIKPFCGHFILTISLVFTIVVGCTSEYSNSKAKPSDPFVSVSFETEKMQNFQLVRAIDFDTASARDAYSLPIQKEQWYLISKKQNAYFLPVYIGVNPSFIENTTRWTKVAVIDTMDVTHLATPVTLPGLKGINKVEIVCFKEGYSVVPQPSVQVGYMTIGLIGQK
jgi:hypothetical protein